MSFGRDERSEAIKSTVAKFILRMVFLELGVTQFSSWVSFSLSENAIQCKCNANAMQSNANALHLNANAMQMQRNTNAMQSNANAMQCKCNAMPMQCNAIHVWIILGYRIGQVSVLLCFYALFPF